jgi:hypothetical protein
LSSLMERKEISSWAGSNGINLIVVSIALKFAKWFLQIDSDWSDQFDSQVPNRRFMKFRKIQMLNFKISKFSFNELTPLLQKFVGEKCEMILRHTEQGIVVTFLEMECEAKQIEIDNVVMVYMFAKYDDIL